MTSKAIKAYAEALGNTDRIVCVRLGPGKGETSCRSAFVQAARLTEKTASHAGTF